MFLRALSGFLILPGFFALLLPPLIAWADPWKGTRQAPGIAVISAGALILLWCVRDFYLKGKGTLAPWDPPEKLVVAGLYRFVRNPMYIGVLLLVLGWSLYFFSPALLIYAIVLAIGFHVRIITYEEPRLKEQFGEDWESFRKNVSRWLPSYRKNL